MFKDLNTIALEYTYMHILISIILPIIFNNSLLVIWEVYLAQRPITSQHRLWPSIFTWLCAVIFSPSPCFFFKYFNFHNIINMFVILKFYQEWVLMVVKDSYCNKNYKANQSYSLSAWQSCYILSHIFELV